MYIDVLIGVNLFVNYFLLLAVAKFFCLPSKRVRLIAGALFGAFFSLAIFLPELPSFLGLLLKLFLSAGIVGVTFPWRGSKCFFQSLACFYLMSFAFAGFMLCMWYFVTPQGFLIKNSVVYFDISPMFLLGATVLCYLLIRLINRIAGRQEPQGLNCWITLERGGKTVSCMARTDTGNTLREPFTGYPVVVIQEKLVKELMPGEAEKAAFRVVPFQAVSGGGLLRAFRPDKLTVVLKEKNIEVRNVYVAVCKTALSGGEFGALISPGLLP